MTVAERHYRKIVLALAAAPIALFGTSYAQGGEEAPRQKLVRHSWSLSSSLFYTDNFSRLSSDAVRFDFSETTIVDNPETGFEIGQLFNSSDVDIEPPDNFIVSGTLSGSTLFRRPIFSGLVTGSITVGSYLNRDSFDDRLLSSANPQPPVTDIFFQKDRNGNDIPGSGQELAVAGSTFGLPDRTDEFIDPNLRGTGTFRVIESLFYVDVSGLIQEQNLGFGGFGASEGVGQSGDEVVFGGLSISPYIFRQFGNDSSLELRARGTAIEVLEEDIDLSRTTNLTLDEQAALGDFQVENDSRSVEGLAEYQSGDLFERFSFKLGVFGRKVEESGSDLERVEESEFSQASGSFDVGYGITKTLSLIAGVGVDEIQFQQLDPLSSENPAGATPEEIAALDVARVERLEDIVELDKREDNLSGLFWSVGFRFVPSRKTDLAVSVGERYGGTLLEVNGKYRPSSRVIVSVAADRRLDSGLQDFASSAFQLQSQAFGILTSLADGQSPASSSTLDKALSFDTSGFRDAQRGQFGVSALNRARLGVRGTFQRTSVSGGVQYAETQAQSRDAKLWSADASLQRQITRRLSASASVRYSKDEGSFLIEDLFGDVDAVASDPFESTEWFTSLSTAYQLGQKLSLTGQLYRVERDSDGRARGTQLEYVENAAGIGLRWVF